MKAITIWVFLFALPLLHAELVQVIQLGRHGARTPNSFKFLLDEYNEKEGELTVLGLVQEYFLGQEMRKRYIEDTNFLSETFNSSEVLIKSSWKNRTMRSAFAFVNGLYPQNDGVLYENEYAEHFPAENLLPLKNKQKVVEQEETKKIKIDEEWAKSVTEVIPMEGDLYFHAAKDENCAPIEKIIKEIKQSHENKEFEQYLGLALYPNLAAVVNKPLGYQFLDPEALNLKMAKSVLDNYRCNTFHRKAHPEVDELNLKLLKNLRFFYAYKLQLVDDLVKSVAATKLFEEFLKYTRGVQHGVPGTPKYIFYSAHDTNLEILFSIFLLETVIAGGEHYNIIPFSSVMSLEVHKESDTFEGPHGLETKDAFYVKMFFNDEPQFIKMCAGYRCTMSQFHRILEHHIVPNLNDFCNAGRAAKATICTSDMC